MNQQEEEPKYQQPHEQRINSYMKNPVNLSQLDPEIMKTHSEQIGQILNQQCQNCHGKLQFRIDKSWKQFMLRPDIKKKYNQYRRFSKETLPMLVFVVFSTGVLTMEGQYDKMKQKVQNSKILKVMMLQFCQYFKESKFMMQLYLYDIKSIFFKAIRRKQSDVQNNNILQNQKSIFSACLKLINNNEQLIDQYFFKLLDLK